MTVNWSTFVLEIINFLVLVWLLKHYLYRPVKRIVERRRQEIEAKLAEADRTRREAEAMKARYQNRLADWEKEKKLAHQALVKELEVERQRRLEALQHELTAARQKAEAVWEQEKREWRRHAEEQVLTVGAQFVAKMLARLADDHLHRRLLAMLLEDLQHWPQTDREFLQRQFGENPGPIRVLSAYPLSPEERQQLSQGLVQLLGIDLQLNFATDASLMAGLRIDLGTYVIRANLLDELQFFSHVRS